MNDSNKKNRILRLRKRAEFLAVRTGERRRGRLFLMEVKKRDPELSEQLKTGDSPRVGFTVTKKNGNAVVRNRIRRRLKEAVRCHAGDAMQPSTDYVIVGRREILNAPFLEIAKEITKKARNGAGYGKSDKERRTERSESGPVNGN